MQGCLEQSATFSDEMVFSSKKQAVASGLMGYKVTSEMRGSFSQPLQANPGAMSAPTTFIVTRTTKPTKRPPPQKLEVAHGESKHLAAETGAPTQWRWAWRAADLPCWFSGRNLDRFAADGQRTLLQLRGCHRCRPASAHDQRLKLLNQQLGPNRLSPNRTSPSPEPVTRSHPRGSPPSLRTAK